MGTFWRLTRPYRFLMLTALASIAHGDVFDIIFTPTTDVYVNPHEIGTPQQQLYTGTITTDGICTVCSITQSVSGPDNEGIEFIAFNPPNLSWTLGDPFALNNNFGSFTLDTTTDALSGFFGDGVGDVEIRIGPGSYSFRADGEVFEEGTLTVTPEVPEPATIFLMGTVAVGVELARKRRLGRVGARETYSATGRIPKCLQRKATVSIICNG